VFVFRSAMDSAFPAICPAMESAIKGKFYATEFVR